MTGEYVAPAAIYVIHGDSPEQVVTRALAACLCNQPEGHPAIAQQMLGLVKVNEGDPAMPFVIILPADGEDAGLDEDAEGVLYFEAGDDSAPN